MPLIARAAAPASVLDVGCGSGALLAALPEIGIPGMGMDSTPPPGRADTLVQLLTGGGGRGAVPSTAAPA